MSNELEFEETSRGFDIASFKDRSGDVCSLQMSSIATEACVWLGVDNPKVYQEGWMPEYPARMRDLPAEIREELKIVMVAGRMHLTQDMVKALLPSLQHFAETGELLR